MIEFKRLHPENVDALINLGIMQDEFSCIDKIDFWSTKELSDWFSMQNDICIGMFANERMIGYCLSHSNLIINKVLLENIFISHEYRKKGFGKLLLEYIINSYNAEYPNHFPKLRFIALAQEDNTKCLNLAKSCGFSIGERMKWMQK